MMRRPVGLQQNCCRGTDPAKGFQKRMAIFGPAINLVSADYRALM
jgi:hypothetical protein